MVLDPPSDFLALPATAAVGVRTVKELAVIDLKHEHFIPLRKPDLLELLCREKDLTDDDRGQFRALSRLLEATFHFEYHRTLDDLLNAYAPFDPDVDTVQLHKPGDVERATDLDKLFDKLRWLMSRANYLRLTREDILKHSEGVSEWGINMDVDFTAFERYDVYVRGDIIGKRSKRRWQNLWRLEEIPLPIFQRLILILKMTKHPRLDPEIDLADVYLKMFKEIPKMDMEMLFPGAKVKLSKVDQGLIGYPILSGLGVLAWKVWQSLVGVVTTVAAGLTTWGIGILLGSIGYRSYYSYNIKKQTYSLKLTKSLYYQTLDSNAGVLYRVVTEAEEQEWREALLGYFFLWKRAKPEGWTLTQLDDYIELYLEGEAKIKVDFEVEDAMGKLLRLGMVEEMPGPRYRAVPIQQALEKLDYAWDNFFQYNQEASPGKGKAP